MNRRTWLPLGLVLLGVIVLWTVAPWRTASAPADVAAAPDTRKLLPVASTQLERTDGFSMQQPFAGRVVARRSSDLGFDRGGRVEHVHVDEGDRVEQGQLLAELDTRELRAQRREWTGRVKETAQRLELARLTSERQRALVARSAASVQAADEARFAESALAAQLESARGSLARIEASLALSRIHAPYAGSIVDRLVDEGTVVATGRSLLRLIEDGALEVQVGVPPEIAQELKERPDTPSLTVRIGSGSYPARLDAIVDLVDTDTLTVTLVLVLDDAPLGVRSGALARVALERRVESDGFWLPVSALAESRRGLWAAYALVPSGETDGVWRVERRELEILHTDASRAYVRGTLRAGERVVTNGVHRLVPEQQVRLAEATSAPSTVPSPAPIGG